MAEPPPDLASLKLPEWVRQHPPRSYEPDTDTGPSDGDMVKTMGKVGRYALRGGLGPVGWLSLGWDVFKALARQEDLAELPARRKEAQREDFRNLMWEKFWTNDAFYDSSAAREAAFDKLVGDNAGHGIAPALTQQAEVKRSELIDRIDDRWLDKLERASELQQRLEEIEQTKPGPDAEPFPKLGVPGEYVSAQDHWAERAGDARRELDSYNTAMAEEAARDIQSVKDFESNPANWDLTPDQQSILTCKTAPEESDQRSDDDKFYDVVGGRQ